MRQYRAEIEGMGYKCVSGWLDETPLPGAPELQGGYLLPNDIEGVEHFKDLSIRDLTDVCHCDVLISFTETEHRYHRGARHVEMGIAIATKKELWVVGPRENVFHYLPWVRHFENWEQCRERLIRQKNLLFA